MRLLTAAAASLLLIVTMPSAVGATAATHFSECVSLTGRNATVIIPLASAPTIGGQEAEPGDELAVFTPDGVCAGAAVWTGQSMAIAVWEDDPFGEEILGFESGAPLAFRLHQTATGMTYGSARDAVSVTYVAPYSTDGIFQPDAIFVVDSMNFSADGGTDGTEPLPFALEPAYPNPFNTSTTFAYSLPEDAEVTLEIFDILGRRVASVVDEHQSAGTYEVRFEPPAGLAAGMLISRLRAGSLSAVTRLTHVR